ncbi:MAG: hypothetical protein C0505_06395 [Leptothrix sp. (in: Bacteria)]|nr:hypothetical protein [Leptothrix sp. (in: b-proteobacteria)]
MTQALAGFAAAALGAATLLAAALPAHAQWAVDYTVRYEAAGQQVGQPGEPRGPDTLVSEKVTWRVQQEVRGTLNYTQKLRGAVARNMPDKNNEQRYDSWISRSGRAGNPAWMKIDAEEVMDSAARLAKADAEGAVELNRQRAGKLGRIEHLRTRITLAGEGPGAAKLNDPFVQIDRVDGKLHFEPPAIDFDPAQVRYTVQKVTRMDKPAAADEWDSGDAKAQRTTAVLSLPLLPVQVFDMPRDAQSLEATRTVDVPGPTGGKATMTIALRRAGAAPAAATDAAAAAATAVAAAPTAAPAARPAAASDPCAPKNAAPATTAADAGAAVGGAALGGGHGRIVGTTVGGFLGALGGKKDKPARGDCPAPAR